MSATRIQYALRYYAHFPILSFDAFDLNRELNVFRTCKLEVCTHSGSLTFSQRSKLLYYHYCTLRTEALASQINWIPMCDSWKWNLSIRLMINREHHTFLTDGWYVFLRANIFANENKVEVVKIHIFRLSRQEDRKKNQSSLRHFKSFIIRNGNSFCVHTQLRSMFRKMCSAIRPFLSDASRTTRGFSIRRSQ